LLLAIGAFVLQIARHRAGTGPELRAETIVHDPARSGVVAGFSRSSGTAASGAAVPENSTVSRARANPVAC